jgi:hypothetical protein
MKARQPSPTSCAECHEIWGPQPAGTLRPCTGIALPLYIQFTAKKCYSTKYTSIILAATAVQLAKMTMGYLQSTTIQRSVLHCCMLRTHTSHLKVCSELHNSTASFEVQSFTHKDIYSKGRGKVHPRTGKAGPVGK